MKDELINKVNSIKDNISNKQEAAVVLTEVSEIIDIFMTKVAELTERQTKLEEKTEEVMEALSDMEEEMIENLNGEFEAECPYCGETIPFKIPEDEEDFECPKCGNTIELEMMFDDENSCDGSCSSHDCSCCHDSEDDDEEEKEKE